ncbi:peroxiredoxin [Pseudonocardia kujensis]|uniref:alkyl hydroperoxide reductase subunit C n=1 Tax=Pseudonocardia kujensis TaxID=1128675 RepID=UPI001E5EB29F|nr:alkyl hydroperoxide reductase subunit C [Pseudonocardia kujensis]MCE0764174.1 peroxiredoxin [Pseudonocardia kujensis]
MSLINSRVKPFTVNAFQQGRFIEITDEDLVGHWSVIVFYPGDFTFVCPTELEDLADHYETFQALGVEVYGASTDSHFAHKAWHETSAAAGKVQFPLLADMTHQLSRDFDVLVEADGQALRGTFVIDPEGRIRTVELHDAGIGRDAVELLRKVKAAQYITAHPGEVCPAKWDEGADTLAPSLDLVGKI